MKRDICILVICNSRHHSQNLINLAESLAAKDLRINVVALCESSEVNFYSKIINREKVHLISLDHIETSKNTTKKNYQLSLSLSKSLWRNLFKVADRFNNYLVGGSRRLSSIAKIIQETTPICYLREKRAKAFYTSRMNLVERVFDQVMPSVVFAFGDRHIDIEVAVLMIARSRRVKIVIPYSTYSGDLGLLKIRQIQGEPKRWIPFSLYRLYAGLRMINQVRKGYFYQHPSVSFALKELGGLSKNPWCIGNGLSDIVCVDSENTSARYLNEGVPRKKINVVGDVAYDTLLKKYLSRSELREEIASEYSFDLKKKIIVFALPQFAEQGTMGWNEHWTEIRYLLGQVAQENFNILVSLHPRALTEDYLFLERDFPVHIIRKPLKEFLPVADVFVAINSSTIFWAVLCGIPVVLINFYELDSSMFNHLRTIKVVNDRSALLDKLADAVSDEKIDFAEDWGALSRATVFDGLVTERYLRIVLQAAATNVF